MANITHRTALVRVCMKVFISRPVYQTRLPRPSSRSLCGAVAAATWRARPRDRGLCVSSHRVELRLAYLSARLAKQGVVIGVRVKRRIEINKIDAGIGKFFPIRKPF